jgi:hypothetical protein
MRATMVRPMPLPGTRAGTGFSNCMFSGPLGRARPLWRRHEQRVEKVGTAIQRRVASPKGDVQRVLAASQLRRRNDQMPIRGPRRHAPAVGQDDGSDAPSASRVDHQRLRCIGQVETQLSRAGIDRLSSWRKRLLVSARALASCSETPGVGSARRSAGCAAPRHDHPDQQHSQPPSRACEHLDPST